jgi:hypothetical protein
MAVITAVKKNRVGAVVISVFDWYRMFFSLILRHDIF